MHVYADSINHISLMPKLSYSSWMPAPSLGMEDKSLSTQIYSSPIPTYDSKQTSLSRYLHQVLHAILSLPPPHTLPPLLLLAHKADLLASGASQDKETLAVSRVCTILERELEKRRVAATSGVGIEGLGSSASGFTSSEGDENLVMAGLGCGLDRPFRFYDWEGGEVELVASWVTADSGKNESKEKFESETPGLDGFFSWLESL